MGACLEKPAAPSSDASIAAIEKHLSKTEPQVTVLPKLPNPNRGSSKKTSPVGGGGDHLADNPNTPPIISSAPVGLNASGGLTVSTKDEDSQTSSATPTQGSASTTPKLELPIGRLTSVLPDVNSIANSVFGAVESDKGEQIEKALTHDAHGAQPKMVRNRWGALKANLGTVVDAEITKINTGRLSETENVTEHSKEVAAAVEKRRKASFSDSRFANKGGKGRNGSATAAQQARMNNARKMAMNRASSLRTRKATPQDQARVRNGLSQSGLPNQGPPAGGSPPKPAPLATMHTGIVVE
jgi:hypothetical protein